MPPRPRGASPERSARPVVRDQRVCHPAVDTRTRPRSRARTASATQQHDEDGYGAPRSSSSGSELRSGRVLFAPNRAGRGRWRLGPRAEQSCEFLDGFFTWIRLAVIRLLRRWAMGRVRRRGPGIFFVVSCISHADVLTQRRPAQTSGCRALHRAQVEDQSCVDGARKHLVEAFVDLLEPAGLPDDSRAAVGM